MSILFNYRFSSRVNLAVVLVKGFHQAWVKNEAAREKEEEAKESIYRDTERFVVLYFMCLYYVKSVLTV